MNRPIVAEFTANHLAPDEIQALRAQMDLIEEKLGQGTTAPPNDAAEVGSRRRRRRSASEEEHQVSAKPTQSNKPSIDTLINEVRDLGVEAGKGKNTQTQFLLKVLNAAFVGAIDVDANKYGPQYDDATKLSEIYVKAQTGATIFDAKAPNQRKTASCTRTIIRLGMYSKGGVQEPINTVNSLMQTRQTLRKDPLNAKKLEDASNMLLRFARDQLKRDRMIEGDELTSYAYKPAHAETTLADFYENMRKKLQALKSAKGYSHMHDNDPEVDTIIQACGDRLVSLAKASKAANTP